MPLLLPLFLSLKVFMKGHSNKWDSHIEEKERGESRKRLICNFTNYENFFSFFSLSLSLTHVTFALFSMQCGGFQPFPPLPSIHFLSHAFRAAEKHTTLSIPLLDSVYTFQRRNEKTFFLFCLPFCHDSKPIIFLLSFSFLFLPVH